jgi:hypothetical protein
MTSLHDIQTAVSQLAWEDFIAFRTWFDSLDDAAWDMQFEQDVNSGRLDNIAKQAIADLHNEVCTEL